MNNASIILALVLILSGCSTSRHHFALSNLKIEGKAKNSLIENRKPDYGDGHRDGCVVMGQISMDIDTLNDIIVIGKVTDSKTNEPLLFASILLVFCDTDNLKSKTDSIGQFSIDYSFKLCKIQTEYVGYRTLYVDLTRMK